MSPFMITFSCKYNSCCSLIWVVNVHLLQAPLGTLLGDQSLLQPRRATKSATVSGAAMGIFILLDDGSRKQLMSGAVILEFC